MAARPQLKATKREIFGKELNQHRKAGKIPANIYGKGIDSLAVFLDEKELKELLKHANETTLLDLIVDSEKPRPVILRQTTSHPLKTQSYDHVDIQQVNLKEKMQIAIPVTLVGENELAAKGEAIVELVTSEIEIEALPTDLPEHYEIDTTQLTEIGQHIYVKDLPKANGVEILTDPEQLVVSLAEPQAQEVEEAPVDEQAQIEGVETTEEAAADEEKSESAEEEK